MGRCAEDAHGKGPHCFLERWIRGGKTEYKSWMNEDDFWRKIQKGFLKGIALILGGDRALYRERNVAGFFFRREE